MGTALITMKIMPNSAEANLDEIQEIVKKIIEEKHGTRIIFKQEPIAFGLKAIITHFDLSEDHDLEPLEDALAELGEISSAQVTDMRRAIE